MKPSQTPCPWCGQPPGSLIVTTMPIITPPGTWSLAGAQTKTIAQIRPCLICRTCRTRLPGHWVDDRHPEFDPQGPTDTLTSQQIDRATATACPE